MMEILNYINNLFQKHITQQFITCFLNSIGEPIKVGLFENNEKILLRITKPKPELENKIKNMKGSEEEMVNILKEFEKL